MAFWLTSMISSRSLLLTSSFSQKFCLPKLSQLKIHQKTSRDYETLWTPEIVASWRVFNLRNWKKVLMKTWSGRQEQNSKWIGWVH